MSLPYKWSLRSMCRDLSSNAKAGKLQSHEVHLQTWWVLDWRSSLSETSALISRVSVPMALYGNVRCVEGVEMPAWQAQLYLPSRIENLPRVSCVMCNPKSTAFTLPFMFQRKWTDVLISHGVDVCAPPWEFYNFLWLAMSLGHLWLLFLAFFQSLFFAYILFYISPSVNPN